MDKIFNPHGNWYTLNDRSSHRRAIQQLNTRYSGLDDSIVKISLERQIPLPTLRKAFVNLLIASRNGHEHISAAEAEDYLINAVPPMIQKWSDKRVEDTDKITSALFDLLED